MSSTSIKFSNGEFVPLEMHKVRVVQKLNLLPVEDRLQAMAGAGFMALASTLKKGEHIRVTLLLGALKGKAYKALELTALGVATILSAFLAFYSTRLVWQSWEIEDISVGIDATPLWIPQIFMALGTIVFFIAFCDELVLELLGKRKAVEKEGTPHE